jgi:hypothetical protein
MRRKTLIAALSLTAGVLLAAGLQTTLTQREVRDPRKLAAILEKNFTATEGYMSSNAVGQVSGVLKATSGVVSAATAGTDYLQPGALSTNFTATINSNKLSITVVKGLITAISHEE